MLQDITNQTLTINKLCHNYLKISDISSLNMLQDYKKPHVVLKHGAKLLNLQTMITTVKIQIIFQ
ncbi:hypothetical protein EBU24_04440 [bacterium]|nr:hypothetical protein [bacterium]